MIPANMTYSKTCQLVHKEIPSPSLIIRTCSTSYNPFETEMPEASSVDTDLATKSECLELFRFLKNKDELSRSCKEIMQMITANDKGVMENDPLNTHGSRRTRGGISHAALQRRFTGKMSGGSLSG